MTLSGPDHHLQCLALIHSAVAVGNLVEPDRAVKDAAGINSSLHYIREKIVHIGPHWGGPAGDDHILIEGRL